MHKNTDNTMSLGRAPIRTARSGDERTNHEATAQGKAYLLDYMYSSLRAYLENCRDVVDFAFDVCQVIDYLRDL